MASLDSVQPTVYGSPVGTRLRSLALQLVESVAAWNRARITRTELSRLSDRTLSDIGLTQTEIDSVRR